MSGTDESNGGAKMEFCRHLRWKSWSREDGDPAAIVASLQTRRGAVHLPAHLPELGPDDDVVAPERCCAARACYRGDRLAGEDLA
ncbi:MAG: hypothetical protein IPK74_39315 [Deltaproteobacteria bacterium]|nr:hypothetical protein [Deltaproteobacteria bacterium]